ncbi:MAG: hypothetical protein ABWY22_01670 [Flavobacterium sp.]
MKTILLLATIMFLSYSCTTQDVEKEQEKAFTTSDKMLVDEFPGAIKAVYFQSWVAGVRGGGSGTDFYIELAQPLPDGVVLSQVYFRDKKELVTMINKTFYEIRFRNDDNNDNNDSDDTFLSKAKNETIINTANFLLQEDNEALLFYYEGDVLKSYLVSDVKEIPPLMYP